MNWHKRHLKEIFEKSPIGILFYDKDGQFVDSNQSALNILKVSKLEDIREFNLFVNPEIKSRKEELLKNGIIKFQSSWELCMAKKYGFYTPTESGVVYIDQTVSVTDSGFLVQIQDITEFTVSEKTLKENDEKLRSLFENISVGISVLDNERNVIYENPALEKILELNKEDLKQKKHAKRKYLKLDMTEMPLDELPSIRVFNEQKPVKDTEIGVIKEDNSIIWTNVSAFPLPFLDWNVLVVTSDITEHKRAEKSTRESEERYRRIVETATEGIWEMDNEYVTVNVNPAMAEMLGYTVEEMIGKPVPNFLFREDLIEYAERMDNRKEGMAGKYETRLKHKDGSVIWTLVSATAKKDPHGNFSGSFAMFVDITERKKLEEELKESHDNLEFKVQERTREIKHQADLLKNVNDAIISADNNYIITSWNPAAERQYGWKAYEAIGKNVFELLHVEYPGKEFSEFLEFIVKSGGYKGEEIHQRKDSSRIIVETTVMVLKDKIKDIIGWVAVIRDITERKKAEEELQRSKENFRALAENSPDSIIRLDKDLRYVYVNSAAAEITGKSPEDFIGKTYKEAGIPEEYAAIWRENNLKAIKNGEIQHYEFEFRTINGSKFIESTAIPECGPDGEIESLLILDSDITEQKKIEKEIKQKNKVLDGINAIFRATITNPGEEEFGKTCLAVCEELTGSKFSFIGEINDKGRFDSIAVSDMGWQACEMVKEQGSESVSDNTIQGIRSRAIIEKKILIFNDPINSPYWSGLPDGHYPITSFLGAPLIYRDKVIGLIALANKKEGYSQEDIDVMEILTTAITESLMHYRALNELNKNQEQLKELIWDLERSNKELEQFAYVSSHDLQEPLRTIASFTQLLERRYKGKFDSDADEFMDYIVEAAVRMKAQIEGLLEYSRVGTKGEEFKPVDMNLILTRTIQNLQVSIEESNAKIIVDALPNVMGDAGQLQRAFQNLISNAIKFRKYEEPLKIRISANKNIYNSEYVFSIKDNGIGIEEQYMERIFIIFQRLYTRDVYKGTGIGLSIVKRIIERHGGRIWVESSTDEGSTFYFTLPVSDY